MIYGTVGLLLINLQSSYTGRVSGIYLYSGGAGTQSDRHHQPVHPRLHAAVMPGVHTSVRPLVPHDSLQDVAWQSEPVLFCPPQMSSLILRPMQSRPVDIVYRI